ncbi:MAG: NEW3 domain-containing protein [Actinobacteria bacterium]|nr:NEW3 domain-containing protein [Actinomycetota bacterium]
METIKRKLPVFFIILTLALSIVLMIPGMLFAQEDEATEEVIAEPVPEELIFDTTLPKIQAKEGETFIFNFNVAYKAGDEPFGIEEGKSEKTFDITVDYPTGWIAAVASGSTEAPAINLKFNSGESLSLMAIPLVKQEPGEYELKATFKSAVEGDTLEGSIEFTAVITATYEISLTTKTGILSTELTSGKDNHYKLIVTNNSSTSVENITLSSTEPEGWQVNFDKKTIESIEAGANMEIDAVINPPEKTIAGDYMLTFSASSENSNSSIDLRATVETPTIWGIVGIGIIVVVIIGVAVIFARLGRR